MRPTEFHYIRKWLWLSQDENFLKKFLIRVSLPSIFMTDTRLVSAPVVRGKRYRLPSMDTPIFSTKLLLFIFEVVSKYFTPEQTFQIKRKILSNKNDADLTSA